MSETPRENILIRGVNWIGDAVMTIPAVRAIRRGHPSAHIVLLVKKWVAPLFENAPYVDEVMVYLDEFSGASGKFRLASLLRKRRFSAAYLLQNAFDAAAFAALAGIPRRIGYARDGRGFLLTSAVKCDEHALSLHHVEYYLNLLREAGLDAASSSPWIFISPSERAAARKRLASLRRPIVGINPGASFGSAKRWLPSRFADVVGRMINERHGSAVIFGGPSETPIADEIMKHLTGRFPSGFLENDAALVLNLAGRSSLRELAALISECDLLVTNDSGPMHVGYAVGTPLVAIFGSTSPEHTGPVGIGHEVIRADRIQCSPCFRRVCPEKDLKCMDAITADEVFSAADSLLPRKRAVFFDRDGTLCKDPDFLRRMEDFELLPGLEHLSRLKDAGFLLVGVSNQSGVARGIVEEGFVKKINSLFVEQHGFDAFYYCPHHPDDYCDCRKPEPGMISRARVELGIDPRKSYVVGDKDVDMELARAAGAKGILVTTGRQGESLHADEVVSGLEEAVAAILSMEARL